MPRAAVSIRKILVATDFSEDAAAALGRAVWLAERTGATLTVAHVITGVAFAAPATAFEPHLGMDPAELRKAERKLRREAEAHLRQWLAPHQKSGVKINTATPAGTPFVELIRLVDKGGYDLLLAGTRGLSRLKRFMVGSTAERLVRKCPCPVWIVRPGHEWPLRSILTAVDYSEVSARTMELAVFLAQLAGSAVTVLHVIEDKLPSNAVAEAAAPESRRQVRRAASNRLKDFVARHAPPDLEVRQQLGVGAPWRLIVRAAQRSDAGMVVMGSVGRTGIPGFFIGNTAEKVLRSCDRSILAVKPTGFVSPVQP
jgi:universal stress protein E